MLNFSRARKEIVKMLTKFAQQSKDRMKQGEEPQCLLDFWMEKVVADMEEAERNQGPMPPYSDNEKIASVVLDFLFASQDASTSSLTWTCALLAEHPEVRSDNFKIIITTMLCYQYQKQL